MSSTYKIEAKKDHVKCGPKAQKNNFIDYLIMKLVFSYISVVFHTDGIIGFGPGKLMREYLEQQINK